MFGNAPRIAAALILLAALALAAGALLLIPVKESAREARVEGRAGGARPGAGLQEPRGSSPFRTPAPADFLADSDGDGLLDWEEGLWATDPRDSDTDGDGTHDGEEVAAGRNPRKPGPSDALLEPVLILPEGTRQAPTAGGQAPTARAPRDTAKEESAKPDASPAAKEDAKKGVQENGEENARAEILRVYGNRLAGALMSTVDHDREVAAFRRFLKEDADREAREELRAIGADYERRAEAILGVGAPREAAAAHRALAERSQAQGAAIKGIASRGHYTEIPEADWRTYNERVLASAKALYALALFFRENRVFFGADEPGAVFNLPEGEPFNR